MFFQNFFSFSSKVGPLVTFHDANPIPDRDLLATLLELTASANPGKPLLTLKANGARYTKIMRIFLRFFFSFKILFSRCLFTGLFIGVSKEKRE